LPLIIPPVTLLLAHENGSFLAYTKKKNSYKMENVTGDVWHVPAAFMLRGRSRHWRDPVC